VQGTAVLVTVLANDWDPDGDPLLVTSITQGTHGQVSVNGDGTVNYLPDPRFKGVDSFSYAVSDGIDTADATVAVSVERGTSSESGGGAKGGGKPGGK
jgi:VCBS repeat-containing protein